MGPAFLLLIAVLNLVGIFFGTQMMLSCFQDKAKCPLFQKYRRIVTCQFVYQATILAANTVDAWNGLENFAHEKSPCGVINLARISATFFMICNCVAMYVIHYHRAVLNVKRALSPNQVMAAALTAGFAISAAWLCFKCLLQDCACYAVIKHCVWWLLFAAVVSVAWWKLRYYSYEEERVSVTSNAAPSAGKAWRRWVCCDKKAVFVAASHLVMLVLLCLFCYQKHEETLKLHEGALYLLALNFVVGIVFPVCFRELINSNYEEQDCQETLVHPEC